MPPASRAQLPLLVWLSSTRWQVLTLVLVSTHVATIKSNSGAFYLLICFNLTNLRPPKQRRDRLGGRADRLLGMVTVWALVKVAY